MTVELLIALVGFAFVSSVTPGPNNMMLLASGVNFGFRRTLPHMVGISLGHAFMVFLVGLGLSGLFIRFPQALVVLKVLSIAYMLWLAWKIAHAAAPQGQGAGGTPFSFLQAAAFQWVNPKAWAMALGAVVNYAGDGGWQSTSIVAIVFCAVNFPSVSLWAAAGEALRTKLQDPQRLQLFNLTMAGLLILSLVPVLVM
jgi:threonine/homoserine/homoserine lactone efflux protein